MSINTNNIAPTVAYDAVATILSGQTLSSIAYIGGFKLCGIFVPALFAGTSLTFKVGQDNTGNLGKFRSTDGTDFVVTVNAPEGGDAFSYIELPIAQFAGVKYLAVLAGSTQTSTVELTLAVSLV